MKKLFYLLITSISLQAIAQAPANYYNSATGTGATLKTQLHNIIKNHSSVSYNGLWSLYNHSAYKDNYYENDGTLLDVYSEKPNSTDSYSFTIGSDQCGSYSNEGDCYNREHVIPQSIFNESSPMKSDAHHVLPTDGKVNGMRSSYPIGKVNNSTWTSSNGSKRGSSGVPGYSGTVFEPIDEFKGDFARIMFYFVTRYEDKTINWNYAMFSSSKYPGIPQNFLDIMLQWHEQDPVSAREIAINNRIYSQQQNRNPFIDNPNFVNLIWGQSSSVQDLNQIYVNVFPNPSKENKINITTNEEVEKINLINLNGQIIQQINKPNNYNDVITIDNLPKGFYLLNVSFENTTITKKVIIN